MQDYVKYAIIYIYWETKCVNAKTTFTIKSSFF